MGICRATTLSKCTGVARPDIYRLMSIFEKMGLIKKTLSNPIMYEANPIDQAIPILFKNKFKEIQELEIATQELINNLSKKQNVKRQKEPEPIMYLVPGTEISIAKRKELLINSKNSVDSIWSWKYYNSLFNSDFKKLVRQAVQRGLKYRLITEIPINARLNNNGKVFFKKIDEKVVIRSIDHSPNAIISIYDQKQVFISMSKNDNPNEAQHLWSNSAVILELAINYFEKVWKRSEML